MAAKSLIEQFNDSVENYNNQNDSEWQSRAANSLARKFKLLTKSAETAEETRELVAAMVDFMSDYIGGDYKNEDLDWETVDRDTKTIEAMGEGLIAAAATVGVEQGTAKRFNLLAAKVVGFGESVNEQDTETAYQEQADKVSEIAEALEKFEPKPAPAPEAAKDDKPPKPGLSLKL